MIGDGLKTDLYQVAMIAASYFVKNRNNNYAVCEAFARKLPPNRRFLIMAGTESIREYLLNLKFTNDDINFLREQEGLKQIFSSTNFSKYLKDFRFKGNLWAMAEGEVVFPNEPLVRVSGKLPEVHMAETFILSVLNHDVYISSRAARMVLASRGRSLLEFGTRRTHHSAALDVARSAYLAGFTATSNLRASQKFNIPCAGTMSHMWVMLSKSEDEAFKDFGLAYKTPTLLVDTYDTLDGIKKATKIKGLYAIRLDSGNFEYLSKEARKILNSKGCNSTKIIVSGDMDEYKINNLLEQNAPIDMFGVGTKLVSQDDSTSPGIVYKAVYDITNRKSVMKFSSSNKATYPGSKQVYLDNTNDKWSHLVALDGTYQSSDELIPLLDQHISNGEVVENSIVDLEVARKYCNATLLNLHEDLAIIDKYNDELPYSDFFNVCRVEPKSPVYFDRDMLELRDKMFDSYMEKRNK